jgi:hypothetical protein
MSNLMFDISQNGWEYSGWCELNSKEDFEYKKLNEREYLITFASGITFTIEFNEEAVIT